LADCLAGERRFGITRASHPIPGSLGTVAAIQVVQPLPDGRSNIVVAGSERFLVSALTATDSPYLVAAVDPITDLAGSAPTDQATRELRGTITMLRDALAVMRDEPVAPADLPESAEALSFVAAALSETSVDAREQLLALRSTRERVELLSDVLRSQARTARGRAAIHLRARSNGHGHDDESDPGPDS
ncbi:MAG: LON peptidase substrate-binding domain-containing protein, partial [Gemmatimonadota bacterium]|nr:LON peptidase substrate-binding domain-containing protein [Gemmatimonadota bacterium]